MQVQSGGSRPHMHASLLGRPSPCLNANNTAHCLHANRPPSFPAGRPATGSTGQEAQAAAKQHRLQPSSPSSPSSPAQHGPGPGHSLSAARSASFTPLLLMICTLLPMDAFSSTTQRRRKQFSPAEGNHAEGTGASRLRFAEGKLGSGWRPCGYVRTQLPPTGGAQGGRAREQALGAQQLRFGERAAGASCTAPAAPRADAEQHPVKAPA